MKSLVNILVERLGEKGMEVTIIPAYIRDLANILADNSLLSLQELNRKLHVIGWDDLELDEYTLQLIIAVIEQDYTFRLPHGFE